MPTFRRPDRLFASLLFLLPCCGIAAEGPVDLVVYGGNAAGVAAAVQAARMGAAVVLRSSAS